jgi:hypothetical protein
MNDIIAKLYDQAIVIESGVDYVCGELDPEKFAELIVKECLAINTRRLFSNTLGDHLGNAHNNAIWCCNTDMQKYFGVEE